MPPSPAHVLETPWPTSMPELSPSERFLVWSFRRWVSGMRLNDGAHLTLVWHEFTRQFGDGDGKQALASFAEMIKLLVHHARRRLRHHQPCCPCLCHDELWIVCLTAACQNRRLRLARSLAEWVVEPDGSGALIHAGARLAGLMNEHALRLPDRVGAPSPCDGRDTDLVRRTIH